MKRSLFKVIVTTIVFSLFFSATNIGNTQALAKEDEKGVKELAEQLKFFWEEATIKDENGNIVGIDFDKMESEFGESPEFTELKSQFEGSDILITNSNTNINGNVLTNTGKVLTESNLVTISSSTDDGHNRCVSSKLQAYFGSFLGPASIAAIMQLLWEGEYTAAAKRLIKLGVKGNVYAVLGTILWILGTCSQEASEGKW